MKKMYDENALKKIIDDQRPLPNQWLSSDETFKPVYIPISDLMNKSKRLLLVIDKYMGGIYGDKMKITSDATSNPVNIDNVSFLDYVIVSLSSSTGFALQYYDTNGEAITWSSASLGDATSLKFDLGSSNSYGNIFKIIEIS